MRALQEEREEAPNPIQDQKKVISGNRVPDIDLEAGCGIDMRNGEQQARGRQWQTVQNKQSLRRQKSQELQVFLCCWDRKYDVGSDRA